MIIRPSGRPVNPHIFYRDSLCYAFAMYRDGQPPFSLRGLDLVAVAPAVLIILHVIIENKKIGAADLIKVPAPGNVGGLNNGDVHWPAVSRMIYEGLSMLRSAEQRNDGRKEGKSWHASQREVNVNNIEKDRQPKNRHKEAEPTGKMQ